MQIKLWKNFSKRNNSTQRPADSGATTLTCTIKESTSIESPVFIIRSNDFNYNYAYAFDHYYFIDDIVSLANDLIEIHCRQDLLATYRTNIYSLGAYVERSASAYNEMIADGYVTTLNNEVISDSVVSVGTLFNSTGVYIISVLNDIGSGAGFTTYYVVDVSTLQAIATYCNQNLGTESTSVLEWIQATYLKTADAVIDCKWLPVSLQALAGVSGLQSEVIKIGKDVLTGYTGLRFKGTVIIDKTFTVNIPHRYTDFRRATPYTKTHMFLPFYSTFEINALDFDSNTITVRYNTDLATGDTTVYLNNGDKLISTINYNIAATAPVGKVGFNTANTLTTTLAAAGGIAAAAMTGNPTALVVAGIAGVNASVQSALAITPSVRGAMAGRSMSANGLDIHVMTLANDTIDPEDLRLTVGRPLNEYRTLSSLSGYVKTVNASIRIPGLSNDRDTINSLLDSGVYLE